jgi:hypothetical protein
LLIPGPEKRNTETQKGRRRKDGPTPTMVLRGAFIE